jgi:hypothetical protein
MPSSDLVAGGAQLRGFSREILEASYKAANETYAEMAATNARFKIIVDSLMSFRNESYFWWQIAELPFATFQIPVRAKSQHAAETGGRSTGHLVDVVLRRDAPSGPHTRDRACYQSIRDRRSAFGQAGMGAW